MFYMLRSETVPVTCSFSHMQEPNVNDELIMNNVNHANITCLCKQYFRELKTTLNGTAPKELQTDVYSGVLSLLKPLQLPDNKSLFI